jgi:hypothetical protein
LCACFAAATAWVAGARVIGSYDGHPRRCGGRNGHPRKCRGMFGRDERDGKADLRRGRCWGRRTDRRRGSGCRDGGGRGGHGGKEIGKICECLVLGGIEGGEWRRRGGILESMDQVAGGGQGAVGGRSGGHGNAGREPGKGVSNAFGTGFRDPDSVAAVMVQGGAEVPTVTIYTNVHRMDRSAVRNRAW